MTLYSLYIAYILSYSPYIALIIYLYIAYILIIYSPYIDYIYISIYIYLYWLFWLLYTGCWLYVICYLLTLCCNVVLYCTVLRCSIVQWGKVLRVVLHCTGVYSPVQNYSLTRHHVSLTNCSLVGSRVLTRICHLSLSIYLSIYLYLFKNLFQNDPSQDLRVLLF